MAEPGKYRIEVSLHEGKTGPYRFRLLARQLRQHKVKAGDRITGRLDVPGRVDVYQVDRAGARRIMMADGTPCEDIEVGYSYTPEPDVNTPGRLCWGMDDRDPECPVSIVVWSESGWTSDYSFRIESTS